MKPRILVIDDESAIRDSLKMILEYEGFDVHGAATGQDGLTLADREPADLVLLDIKMAGMDGLEVLQRLRATHEALPVIMISGHATVSTAVEATKLGAFDFIEKPLSTERVLVSVRNALDQQRLTQEVVAFRRTETLKHQLVGDSAGGSRRPGRRQARGADLGDRAHHRRERRRQGAGGARDSSQQPARRASASSRSTAPRFPTT